MWCGRCAGYAEHKFGLFFKHAECNLSNTKAGNNYLQSCDARGRVRTYSANSKDPQRWLVILSMIDLEETWKINVLSYRKASAKDQANWRNIEKSKRREEKN